MSTRAENWEEIVEAAAELRVERNASAASEDRIEAERRRRDDIAGMDSTRRQNAEAITITEKKAQAALDSGAFLRWTDAEWARVPDAKKDPPHGR